MNRKRMLAVVLCLIALASGIVYAVIVSVNHPINSGVTVGQIGVDTYLWQTGETMGSEVNSITFPMVLVGSAGIQTPTNNLLIKNTGDAIINVSFSSTLATNIGVTCIWQIEVCTYSGISSRQYTWAVVSNDGSFSYNDGSGHYGTGTLPSLTPGGILGYEPTLGSEHQIDVDPHSLASFGHLRMAMQVTANPTIGVYSFTETVIGAGSN